MSIFPTHERLARILAFGPPFRRINCAQRVHPNPRFYKYRWWIFHPHCKREGEAFWRPENALSTATAMALLTRLTEAEISCIVYNEKKRRLGTGVFDESRADQQWATPYDEDEDPSWNGHR